MRFLEYETWRLKKNIDHAAYDKIISDLVLLVRPVQERQQLRKASCVCCRNVPVISDRAVLPSMVRTFLHCQWMICSPVFAARKSR